MPTPHAGPAAAHGAEHLVAEYLAAKHLVAEYVATIVLIGAGLLILGLLARRQRLGRPSPVALATPADPAASVRATLFAIAICLAIAGAALALGATQAHAAGSVGQRLGVGFGMLALVVLAAARFGVGRLDHASMLRARTALSIAIVPIVGVAFLAVVVTLAAPSSAGIIAGH